MARHGIYVSQATTAVSTPVVAESGVPFVIGASPIQVATNPATPALPKLCTSFEEFEEQFGYSDDWANYNLCEFAYSHFKIYGCQPVIFCNLLDPTKSDMKETVAAADIAVTDGKATITADAIKTTIVVKAAGGTGAAYEPETDYNIFYFNGNCIIELTDTHADEEEINVAYNKIKPSAITANVVAANMDTVEQCISAAGVMPDLLCAPGFSSASTVAAVMATKAKAISGVFTAKALIDIDASVVTNYADCYNAKNTNNFTDVNEIVCWPMVGLGDKQYHFSTALAGIMASTDTDNSGIPVESPSNKSLKMDRLALADGTVVNQTKAQADTLNGYGIVTALNFLSSGWVCWGNYTAVYPASTDVKDYFIPVSRMFGWVGNTLVKTFWSKLDKPMTNRLVDSVVDSTNIWLSGLVSAGYLLGARVEMFAAENPVENLMAGIIKIHIYITPPNPAQEIDFVLEYDAEYLRAAFA